MPINQENVSSVLSALSHPLRREILVNLSEKGECSFTDLMNALDVDTGKLSFHIRGLAPFVEQTPTGRYRLNKVGENAIRLVRELESWAEEAKIRKPSLGLSLASVNKRVSAFLIDFFAILGVTIVVSLPNSFSLLAAGAAFSLDLNIIPFVTLALLWAYSTLLEGFKGQSLGKRVLGLKVVRVDGKNLSYDYAAVRNFGKTFLLPFDLLFGFRLNDRRYIRYFDKFAGTTVIDLRS